MKLKPDQKLTVLSMGKAFNVTAIFSDDGEANNYMAKNKDEAVIAAFGPYCLIAEVHSSFQYKRL